MTLATIRWTLEGSCVTGYVLPCPEFADWSVTTICTGEWWISVPLIVVLIFNLECKRPNDWTTYGPCCSGFVDGPSEGPFDVRPDCQCNLTTSDQGKDINPEMDNRLVRDALAWMHGSTLWQVMSAVVIVYSVIFFDNDYCLNQRTCMNASG